jgi:Beta-galactosidase
MSTSYPRPQGAWAQQILTLLVATCLSLLAISVGATARTTQPTATISSATLRGAIAVRAADRRALAHDSNGFAKCLRTDLGHCGTQRLAVAHARTRLAIAERYVRSLSARIARVRHTHAHSGAGTSGSGGSGTGGGSGTSGSTTSGSGTSGPGTNGSGKNGSGGNSGAPISGSGTTGTHEGTTGNESNSPTNPFGEPFVKGVVTNIQGWGVSAMPQIASEMTMLGVNWAREDLSWADTEPEKGVYNWSSFDQMVAAAKADGITVLPIVGYAPSWTSPDNATEYAAFVKAAVERYGPGTSANLQWWELWNEPYDAYAWSGHTPEPEAYAKDALAAAQAARAISSSVKLLVAADYNDSPQAGGTTPWQTSWIDDMFTAVPNLGQWINGVAVHPYGDDPALPLLQAEGWKDANGEWAFQRIDTIHQKFLAHGVNVPFWITEEGWSTWEASEANQAKDYSDLTEQVKLRPWIRALFPYCLREFNEKPANNQSGFGLLKFGTWQPKQAFYTLQAGLKTLT